MCITITHFTIQWHNSVFPFRSFHTYKEVIYTVEGDFLHNRGRSFTQYKAVTLDMTTQKAFTNIININKDINENARTRVKKIKSLNSLKTLKTSL